MTTEKQSYTIADLLALDNDALNAMAAELRGWTLRVEEYRIGHPLIEAGVLRDYISADGRTMSAVADYSPSLDRNQSRACLKHATTNGVRVDVCFRPEVAYTTFYIEAIPLMRTVQGNDARAETVAFCAAMLAMAGRLK